MILLNLHILCIKDERSEDDIKLAKQLAELEIPTKDKVEDKIKNEWRFGTLVFDNVDAFYPDVTGKHTLMHTKGGTVVNIRESYPEVEAQVHERLNNIVNTKELQYNYSLSNRSIPVNDTVIINPK